MAVLSTLAHRLCQQWVHVVCPGNNIGEDGATAVADALKVNRVLSELWICSKTVR